MKCDRHYTEKLTKKEYCSSLYTDNNNIHNNHVLNNCKCYWCTVKYADIDEYPSKDEFWHYTFKYIIINYREPIPYENVKI